MRTVTKLAAFLVLAVAFLGCATSGPTFSELRDSLPEASADTGRIYIYRSSAVGAAVQPAVRVNGEAVGMAVPRGFIYVDRPAGNYQIETSTEVKRTLSLTLDEGATRYVRLMVSMGFFVGHVYPELVDHEVGESEIQKLRYTGGQ